MNVQYVAGGAGWGGYAGGGMNTLKSLWMVVHTIYRLLVSVPRSFLQVLLYVFNHMFIHKSDHKPYEKLTKKILKIL